MSKKQSKSQNIVKDKLFLLSKKSLDYRVFLKEFDFLHSDYGIDVELEILKALGLNYHLNKDNQITLKSRFTPIKNEVFCVVDIETNGTSFKSGGHIIEIGAIKYQNNQIIDKFNSFVYAPNIPQNITELTGITEQMIKNAPSAKEALKDFKMFLQDSIFVAHNVSFDYGFISGWCEKLGYGPLLNRSLCTLELSRRCILAPKHGLESLKQILNIDSKHHRALSDALSAMEVLKHCIKHLPIFITTTEELISFSKTNQTKIIKSI